MRKNLENKTKVFYGNMLLAVMVWMGGHLAAQVQLTEPQAIEMALKNHPAIAVGNHLIRQQEVLKNAGAAWEPSQLFHQVAADPEFGLFGVTTLGVQQNFPSGRQTKANQSLHASRRSQAIARQGIIKQGIVRQVREIYHHLSYLDGKALLYHRLDSVYQRVAQAADSRYRAGDVSLMEKLAALDKARQIQLEAQTVHHEIEFDRIVLGQLLGLSESVQPLVEPLHEGRFSIADTSKLRTSALAQYGMSTVEVARSEQSVAMALYAPKASVGVFGQYLGNGDVYPGWQFGLNLPLFRKSLKAQSEAAAIGIAAAEAGYGQTLLRQLNEMAHLLHEQEKYLIRLEYYTSEGKLLAAELLRTGEMNYVQGELSFADFVQLLEQAVGIELTHLDNLLGLNQTIIELEALIGG